MGGGCVWVGYGEDEDGTGRMGFHRSCRDLLSLLDKGEVAVCLSGSRGSDSAFFHDIFFPHFACRMGAYACYMYTYIDNSLRAGGVIGTSAFLCFGSDVW